MDLDRRLEVRQAFNEFWRRMNVNFYDPKMHGVDWHAVRLRYEPLLAGVGTKEDFWYLLSEMVGELNSSHSEISPAPGSPGFNTAELGITFDENYAGPGLKVSGYMPKGPNDDLGPKIKPGEYVLQIDGSDVRWNEDTFDTLLDKAGKIIELLVNDKASKEGARTVKVKPITRLQWSELAYDRRVQEARARVDKLSEGRLAYIRIQAMNQPSLRKLERELWGKAREKDGLVLDVRGNTGGNTHDDILNQLSRVPYAYVQPRDAPKSTQPFRHWDKPIVLLIDENSVSDAEIFPNGFRALKLGKIVGVQSPGYVIGTYEGTLQDGTGYRMPTQGYFTLDGKDLENNGVKPDILVTPTVEDIAAHRDRQLEVAVETLLKEIPKKSASARSGGVK
jgi:tricorn protease